MFWQGNHPGASGTDKLEVSPSLQRELSWSTGIGRKPEALLAASRAQAISVDSVLTADDLEELRGLPDEGAKMSWFAQRVHREWSAGRTPYLEACARRLTMLLWFDPTNPRSFVLAYRAPYVILLVLALCGCASMARRRQWPDGYGYWAAAMAALLLVHTSIIMSARFRLPIEALYLLPASAATDRAITRLALAARSMAGWTRSVA